MNEENINIVENEGLKDKKQKLEQMAMPKSITDYFKRVWERKKVAIMNKTK